MSKIVWDAPGERYYETGVSKGVLFPKAANGTYEAGVAWNGLISVTESPSGAEATKLWADDRVYGELRSAEEFGATIEAYTYPPEFAPCNGLAEVAKGGFVGQQKRKPFGMCYRTVLGNDESDGYKLHLIYGATAAPSEVAYSTINESPEGLTMSWELTTTPVDVVGHKPTATFVVDSTTTDAAKLAQLEAILYGKDATTTPVAPAVDPRLPLPAEIITLLGPVT